MTDRVGSKGGEGCRKEKIAGKVSKAILERILRGFRGTSLRVWHQRVKGAAK
jgi:hypothetical protein